MKIAVVYFTDTGRVFSVHGPSSEAEWQQYPHMLDDSQIGVMPGQAKMIFDRSLFETVDVPTLQAALDRITGKNPTAPDGMPMVDLSPPPTDPPKE